MNFICTPPKKSSSKSLQYRFKWTNQIRISIPIVIDDVFFSTTKTPVTKGEQQIFTALGIGRCISPNKSTKGVERPASARSSKSVAPGFEGIQRLYHRPPGQRFRI